MNLGAKFRKRNFALNYEVSLSLAKAKASINDILSVQSLMSSG